LAQAETFSQGDQSAGMKKYLYSGQAMALFLWRKVDTFLAPDICPLCRQQLVCSGGVCQHCEKALPQLPDDRCPLCGGSRGETGLLEICRQCVDAGGHSWYRGVSAFPFQGLAREGVHRFKYQKQTFLAPFFAARMVQAWRQHGAPARPQQIVPVPLHWSRLWQRGFNQSAMLAEFIGKDLHLPVCHALKRQRRTSQQAGLSREERGKNMRNAFKICVPQQIFDQSILLIDDVFTTGNTLQEASKVLLKNGAAEVNVLTIARD
jgi:ComF family protein